MISRCSCSLHILSQLSLSPHVLSHCPVCAIRSILDRLVPPCGHLKHLVFRHWRRSCPVPHLCLIWSLSQVACLDLEQTLATPDVCQSLFLLMVDRKDSRVPESPVELLGDFVDLVNRVRLLQPRTPDVVSKCHFSFTSTTSLRFFILLRRLRLRAKTVTDQSRGSPALLLPTLTCRSDKVFLKDRFHHWVRHMGPMTARSRLTDASCLHLLKF